MEDWQTNVIVGACSAVVAAASSVLAYWLKIRSREKDRQAEYEDWKRKRKVRGDRQKSEVELMEKITALAVEHKKHGLTPEHLLGLRDSLLRPASKRKKRDVFIEPLEDRVILTDQVDLKIEKGVEVTEEVGKSKPEIEYDEEGNQIGWTPDFDDHNTKYETILLRNVLAFEEEKTTYQKATLWHYHQQWKAIADKVGWTDKDKEYWELVKDFHQKTEERFGSKLLESIDDLDWARIDGRLEALAWATGDEWQHLESVDRAMEETLAQKIAELDIEPEKRPE